MCLCVCAHIYVIGCMAEMYALCFTSRDQSLMLPKKPNGKLRKDQKTFTISIIQYCNKVNEEDKHNYTYTYTYTLTLLTL